MEPARLLVAPPDGPELQYLLQLDEIVIGRDGKCAIVLSHTSVSRRHARLRIEDGKATIEDLGSTNLTRVNGKVVKDEPRRLADGDCIKLGRVELRYVGPVSEERAPALDEATQTQMQTVMEEGRLTTMLAQDHTLLDSPEADAGLLTIVLASTSGPRLHLRERNRTKEFRLSELRDEIAIGRESGCRIQLHDQRASNRHAVIAPTEGGFVLRDLGSRNGTQVNGIAVTEHRLAAHDVIRIGSATILFADEPGAGPAASTQRAGRRPVVLVPGLSGTELWNGEKRVWPGKMGMFTGDEERMHEDWEAAIPGKVVRGVCVVPGLAKFDRFGDLLGFIRDELGYESPEDVLEFPYDWRRSNVETARDLAIAVRNWRQSRRSPTEKITIVSYSMGGIATRLSLAREGLADAVERVLFLGTPHGGTPQTLHLVIAGGGMLPFGIGLRRIQRLLLSFPSYYELFPALPLVELEDGSPFLPFEADPDWLPRDRRGELERAARVRRLLDAKKRLPVPATCIFGFDQKTLSRLVVRRERGGSIALVSETRNRCGDGQVPEESAVLEGAEVQPVRQQHGVLYSDRDFQRRLRYELVERPRDAS
jgi:pSer/pThr/pTyr-binding forkhead associated (FHA) protein